MSEELPKSEAKFDQYGIQFVEPLTEEEVTAEIGQKVFGKILTKINTGLGAGYPIFELWFSDGEGMLFHGTPYISLLAPKPVEVIDELNPDAKLEGVEEQKEIPQGA